MCSPEPELVIANHEVIDLMQSLMERLKDGHPNYGERAMKAALIFAAAAGLSEQHLQSISMVVNKFPFGPEVQNALDSAKASGADLMIFLDLEKQGWSLKRTPPEGDA